MSAKHTKQELLQMLDRACEHFGIDKNDRSGPIIPVRTSPACKEFMAVFSNPTISREEKLAEWDRFVDRIRSGDPDAISRPDGRDMLPTI